MKKIGVLALVLVFAFAALGIGYAHWSQTLYVEGTVNTGELCWGFVEGSCFHRDPGTTNDWTCDLGFANRHQLTKHVGSTTCVLEGPKGVHRYETFPGSGVWIEDTLYATANVTLDNVYPCYFNEISVVVANGGTIPIIFEKVLIDGTEVGVGELYVIDFMEFKWLNGVDTQLDPCDSHEYSFYVHILEEGDHAGWPGYPDGVPGAQPDSTYYFTIELVGTQWNAP